ncbi:MAG: type IV pilin N-terminal domain-containing protein [Methanolinea sp.]|nr:MAG: type IV pilin N-terminal domain-containing protein [Methanolinea sp.]
MMKRNEDAVSPVVGVMLMLVVTIIIAAVVSGFAGGLAGGTKAAPQASIDVRFMQDDGGMRPANVQWKMVFEHLSGDSIPTKDLEIVTYYTLTDGTIIKHRQTPASESTDLYGYGTFTRVPYINDMSLGYSGINLVTDFGNYTWTTGDVLSSGSDAGTSALLGFDITDSSYGFGSGGVVDVKILHTPSGKYIYDKEVIVL